MEIGSDDKFGIKLKPHDVILTIQNAQLEDAGKYELRGSNAFQVESLILTVIVKGKIFFFKLQNLKILRILITKKLTFVFS